MSSVIRGCAVAVAVFEVDPWDLVETVREGLLVLDCDLAIRFANRSFCETLAVEPEDLVGGNLYAFGNKQSDIPEFRTGHCQSKFYTGVRGPPPWKATIDFPRKSRMRQAHFNGKKRLLSYSDNAAGAINAPTTSVARRGFSEERRVRARS